MFPSTPEPRDGQSEKEENINQKSELSESEKYSENRTQIDEKGKIPIVKHEENDKDDSSGNVSCLTGNEEPMNPNKHKDESHIEEKDKMEFILCRWDSNDRILPNWVHVTHFQHKQIETPPSESASMAHSAEPVVIGMFLICLC
ncbi:hypothetical protein RFI_21459 [Reticulomyxa filosa]|uniref:Uncharacterized protein n=1 Tax=Reticulomyxa filosa TaxID=46433 RepID=X6MQK3_RETFI|nr:hypothetical protein RFI_21459 [Reticulomyxa filosa]|eukprot:ETO15906.1 hypothetical protein RFI_21459 [Reticulomyxa filosa]